jgi:aryl-alcohol dehydrogenase-like predicted oxidoreductase
MERRGVKPGQRVLAWVLARGLDVVPISGTKRRAYLEENVAAAQIKRARIGHQEGNVVPNIGLPLFDCARVASS